MPFSWLASAVAAALLLVRRSWVSEVAAIGSHAAVAAIVTVIVKAIAIVGYANVEVRLELLLAITLKDAADVDVAAFKNGW